MSLTKQERDALKDDDFAVPGKRKLPMHDKKHVKMAWDMVDKTKDLTDDERKTARTRILQRAHTLGIDTKDWNTMASMAFEAMSLEVPETEDHPNKMPFSGVLTKIDELSDKPPRGSEGKLVMITRAAAEAAIPTLLGMAVDLSDNFDSHDYQNKVGIITDAEIVGNDLRIEGFIYASDFPEEAEYIQEHCADLGFSYEVKRVYVKSLDESTLTVTGLTFTGAAILKKKDAAYTTTSLSAHADVETDMTKEEMIEALKPFNEKLTNLAAQVEELKTKGVKASDQSAGSVASIVNPHSSAIRAAADGMEKAGLGGHPQRGHVKQLHAMADCMDAEAVLGKLPHMYDSGSQYYASADAPSAKDLEAAASKANEKTDKQVTALAASVEALSTQIKDLAAKAFDKAPAPERKTLSPQLTSLLARGGITLDASGEKKLTVDQVDKCLKDAGITDITQRVGFKTQLAAAGHMVN